MIRKPNSFAYLVIIARCLRAGAPATFLYRVSLDEELESPFRLLIFAHNTGCIKHSKMNVLCEVNITFRELILEFAARTTNLRDLDGLRGVPLNFEDHTFTALLWNREITSIPHFIKKKF